MEVVCFPGFKLLSANVAWRYKASASRGIFFCPGGLSAFADWLLFARGGLPHFAGKLVLLRARCGGLA